MLRFFVVQISNQKSTLMKTILPIIVLMLFFFQAKTQSTTSNETHDFITYDTVYNLQLDPWHTVVYRLTISRPVNMFTAGHPDTASRPAIITMPGIGEMGTDPSKTKVYGPHFWLKNGWDGSVALGNGKHYPILITLICDQRQPYPNWNLAVLNYLLKTYHIKRNAVHLAGLSQGAFTWSAMITYEATKGDEAGMKNVTSLALLSGAASTTGVFNLMGHWAKKYKGKLFATVNPGDAQSINPPVAAKSMNDSLAGTAYFAWNNLSSGTNAHCCWNSVYDPNVKSWQTIAPLGQYVTTGPSANSAGTYKTGSLFQWMLRQGDTSIVGSAPVATPTPTPAPNQAPVVNAGAAQTITLPINQVNLAGNATDADGTIAAYAWTKVNGGAATIASPSTAATAITGLVAGNYVFRLTVTDNLGSKAVSDVTVTVNAAVVTPPVTDTVVTSTGLRVVKVVTCEYRVGFLMSDGKLYGVCNMTPTTVPYPIAAGRKLVDGAAGFNKFKMLDDQGYVWSSRIDYTTNMDRIDTDTAGVAFDGNASIYAYAATTLTIKKDGSLWYMGDDTFHLFHATGRVEMRPVRLSPAGMICKKVDAGSQRIIVLTTAGEVYEWTKGGSKTPVLKVIPRPAIDIFGSHANYGGCIIPDATGSQTMGYPFIWGTNYGNWGGTAPFSQPTSVRSLWKMTAPIKEISSNWNTIHYIDSMGRLFGLGFNAQGEVGNGEEIVNRHTYATFPGYGWDFGDGENSVTTPVEIGKGIKWKKLYSNNFFCFYKYAQDEKDSIYSWGRNKAMVLGNGFKNLQEQYSPNSMDVLVPTMVHPMTVKTQTYNFTAPSINAGPKVSVTATTVTLTGSAKGPQLIKSTAVAANGIDKVGFDIVSYQWTKISGPDAVIATPNAATTIVNGLTTGTYVFNLTTVDANKGTQSANDTVVVTAPQFTVSTATAKLIPGKFEAENYDSATAVKNEITSDASGVQDVTSIDSADWMDYKVNVAAAGTYKVSFRVATLNPNAAFVLRSAAGRTLASIKLIKPTGGYQAWATISTQITLPAGIQTIRLVSTSAAGWNINWMSFEASATVVASSSTENSGSSVGISTFDTASAPVSLSKVSIYPNPVRDHFTVDIDNDFAGMMNIQVIDISGKVSLTQMLAKSGQRSQVNISASALTPGIYMVRIQMGSKVEVKKLLKL